MKIAKVVIKETGLPIKVKTPERGTPLSAGIDFFVPSEYQPMFLSPGECILIPSGIKVNVPPGKALVAFNKSGIASKLNLHVGACVVDEDYQGEVHINLVNNGLYAVEIKPDMKIVQFLLLDVGYDIPELVEEADLFSSFSSRGTGGFGSTGQ